MGASAAAVRPRNEFRVRLKRQQSRVFKSRARFRLWAAGRRSGKTYEAQAECLRALLTRNPRHNEPRLAAYIGPTRKQAKEIAWARAKAMTRPYWACKPYETELRIVLVGGHELHIKGAENYDALRGLGWDFIVLDEYADMHPETWQEVVRPALADRQGRALFIGTPKGFQHFYELRNKALHRAGWEVFESTTLAGGLVSPEEIEAARLDMDAAVFRQELEASFEDLTTGRVYYAWTEDNRRPCEYDPQLPIRLCCDFGVNPIAWTLCQQVPDQAGNWFVNVLREIVIFDSNTEQACDAFKRVMGSLAPAWQTSLEVYVYGDASGHTPSSSNSKSDWEVVKRWFRTRSEYKTHYRLETANPSQKDRVTAVNRMLSTVDDAGFRKRMFVDPSCAQTVEDFRRVVWHVDAAGNSIVKISKKDPKRTHASDSVGYYIWTEFGLRSSVGFRSGLIV